MVFPAVIVPNPSEILHARVRRAYRSTFDLKVILGTIVWVYVGTWIKVALLIIVQIHYDYAVCLEAHACWNTAAILDHICVKTDGHTMTIGIFNSQRSNVFQCSLVSSIRHIQCYCVCDFIHCDKVFKVQICGWHWPGKCSTNRIQVCNTKNRQLEGWLDTPIPEVLRGFYPSGICNYECSCC